MSHFVFGYLCFRSVSRVIVVSTLTVTLPDEFFQVVSISQVFGYVGGASGVHES